MENALGLTGYQATMMTIVFALGILGIGGLLMAIFWPKRWKMKYRMEIGFVVLLAVLVWYADRKSTEVYSAYQADLNESGELSVDGYEAAGEFDRTLRVIAFQWGFAFLTDEDEISRNAAVVQPGERVLFEIMVSTFPPSASPPNSDRVKTGRSGSGHPRNLENT